MRVILAVLLLAAVCFGQEGVTKTVPGYYYMLPIEQSQASTADWFWMDTLNISVLAGDVVVASRYGTGYRLKAIYNNSGSVVTVKMTFQNTATTITMKIAEYSWSGKLPVITGITKTGTSDSLLLAFQLKNP